MTGSGSSIKHGNVAFIGETQFSSGEWIGIILDTAEGKNDGTVAGVKYFECETNMGLFVRAAQVKSSASSVATAPASVSISCADATNSKELSLPKAEIISAREVIPPVAVSASEKDTRDKLAILREKRRARESGGLNVSTEFQSPSPKSEPSDQPITTPVAATTKESSHTSEFNAENSRLAQKLTEIEQLLAQRTERLAKKEDESLQLSAKVLLLENAVSAMQAKQVAVEKTAEVPAGGKTDSLRSLENQLMDLNDTIESLVLDKEQLLVEKEILEENQAKLSEQVAKLMLEMSDSKCVDQRAVSEENSRLREALSKLHQVSTQEQELHQRLSKESESSAEELVSLRKFKTSASAELDDLRRALNDSKSGEYEALIEALSEKNHSLEERSGRLEVTVHDLESAQELMEELDGSQRAEIDRLRKDKDCLQVTLHDKNQEIIELVARCAELKGLYERLAKSTNSAIEESSALKFKLQLSTEELEERTAMARSVGNMKAEVDSLKTEIVNYEVKLIEAETSSMRCKTAYERATQVFAGCDLWSQEHQILAREVQALALAYLGSKCAQARKSGLSKSAVVTKEETLVAVAVLEGTRECWQAVVRLLSSSSAGLAQSPTEYSEMFIRGQIVPSIMKQLIQQSVRERCRAESESLQQLIALSFLLLSIEVLAIAIPKMSQLHEFPHVAELCKTIAIEVSTATLQADCLLVEYGQNAEKLFSVYDSLLAVVLQDGRDEPSICSTLRECMTSTRSLQQASPRAPSSTTLLDPSLLIGWSTSSSEVNNWEWPDRVEKARKKLLLLEQDSRKYYETATALDDLRVKYELRQEEAKAATTRANELRKMLDSSAGVTRDGDSILEQEVKTLTQALEVLELRYENVEKELKKSKSGMHSNPSGSNLTERSTATQMANFDSLNYWRRIASQRLTLQLSTLNGTIPVKSNPTAECDSSTLATYRLKRRDRACIRVKSA